MSKLTKVNEFFNKSSLDGSKKNTQFSSDFGTEDSIMEQKPPQSSLSNFSGSFQQSEFIEPSKYLDTSKSNWNQMPSAKSKGTTFVAHSAPRFSVCV